MDWDEVRPAPRKALTVGEDLSSLSVGELEERIAALQGEIARVEAEIARKRAHESAASALFKR
jgi:uncharacterized small protein (DUF1192 family)